MLVSERRPDSTSGVRADSGARRDPDEVVPGVLAERILGLLDLNAPQTDDTTMELSEA